MRRNQLIYRVMLGSLSTLLLSSFGSAAIAQSTSPRLQDLLETIPARPVPAPAETEATETESVETESVETEPVETESVETESAEQTLSLRLDLSDRRVYVQRGETVETSYPVAVGRSGWETPIGDFEVSSQLSEPGWTNPFTNEIMPPGPDNPLGDRWIGFWTDGTNVIGFHGTPNRDSVGQAASHGCVRMYNEHIRELYDIIALGTPVTVEP
ncbi:MAG: L,D-transpeptidase [Phormidesmis sp.]